VAARRKVGVEGVGRNASEPDLASLRTLEVTLLPEVGWSDTGGEATSTCSHQASRGD